MFSANIRNLFIIAIEILKKDSVAQDPKEYFLAASTKNGHFPKAFHALALETISMGFKQGISSLTAAKEFPGE